MSRLLAAMEIFILIKPNQNEIPEKRSSKPTVVAPRGSTYLANSSNKTPKKAFRYQTQAEHQKIVFVLTGYFEM